MSARIPVWREASGRYERVGSIRDTTQGPVFAYETDYAGEAISVRMPVRAQAYDTHATRTFFSALSPEGDARRDLLRSLHMGGERYTELLEALNEESMGALLFGDLNAAECGQRYEEVEKDFFEAFSREPRTTSISIVGKTRVSIAGAMAKVGLYRNEEDGRWFLPMGAAPSTHIVKAGDDELFPDEVTNEALCLLAATLCDLPTEDFELVGTQGSPLLVR